MREFEVCPGNRSSSWLASWHAAARRGWTALALLTAASFVLSCSELEEGPPGGGVERLPRNLILITADTWRADFVMTKVAGVDLTPELARFAQRSIRFMQADSVGNATSPGVAGILTGLHPWRSGVTLNVHVLSLEVPTLATILRGAGFQTAAIVANPVLGPGFGFERGFESYSLLERKRPVAKVPGKEVVDEALRWLADRREPDRQFFLWVHFMDPHGPYRPPEAFDHLFDRSQIDAPVDLRLLDFGDDSGRGGVPHYQWNRLGPGATDGRDYIARYAAEVRSLDAELGRLLDSLEDMRALDDSAIVVSSDHGEAMAGEDGYFFSHQNDLTTDQVHVPLFLYFPGCEAAASSDRAVSTIDILPTAIGLLGVSTVHEQDGVSLLSDSPRELVGESYAEVSVREGRWRLRRRKNVGSYSLDDVTGGGPVSEAELPIVTERLAKRLEELRGRPPLGSSIARDDLSAAERQALEALGYVE